MKPPLYISSYTNIVTLHCKVRIQLNNTVRKTEFKELSSFSFCFWCCSINKDYSDEPSGNFNCWFWLQRTDAITEEPSPARHRLQTHTVSSKWTLSLAFIRWAATWLLTAKKQLLANEFSTQALKATCEFCVHSNWTVPRVLWIIRIYGVILQGKKMLDKTLNVLFSVVV